MLSIIVAKASNDVIGGDNKLLWHISEDLKRFKEITSGHTIIMGRKTFESIGFSLPDRFNIVVSRSKVYRDKNVISASCLEDAIEIAEQYALKNNCEIFLCGGFQIYSEGIKYADKLFITELSESYDGDVFFPELDKNKFKLIKSDKHMDCGFCFNVYERKN